MCTPSIGRFFGISVYTMTVKVRPNTISQGEAVSILGIASSTRTHEGDQKTGTAAFFLDTGIHGPDLTA